MPSRNAKAEKVSQRGYRMGEVEININHVGNNVYLTVTGDKRMQMYTMPLSEWRKLVNTGE